jgi:CRISPR-associated RAMP protein (TIGR02581 family)
MFATLQNIAQINFSLVPDGPILVRAQTSGLDPGVAEQEFQRTVRQGRPTVFLAGSGLKGALRAHCERLLRSAGVFACEPTRWKDEDGRLIDETCSNSKARNMRRQTLSHPFADHCAACMTFGSTSVAGRFQVRDAYPTSTEFEATNRVEARFQVGLDRRSQGPATGALFDLEVVTGGAFAARIDGENFGLWQLALVLQGLRDLGAGLVRIGGMKSRGMGAMTVEAMSLRFLSLQEISGNLVGAGTESRRKDRLPWGLKDGDTVDLPTSETDGEVELGTQGLLHEVTIQGGALERLADSLVSQKLRPFLEERATA